jgi:SOS-response transcriptional repressor LexA
MGGIGTNAVFGHLMALEAKGYIERPAGIARAIRVLSRA